MVVPWLWEDLEEVPFELSLAPRGQDQDTGWGEEAWGETRETREGHTRGEQTEDTRGTIGDTRIRQREHRGDTGHNRDRGDNKIKGREDSLGLNHSWSQVEPRRSTSIA